MKELFSDKILGQIDRFAEMAHSGQERKYTGDPYVVHVRAVSKMVHESGGDSYQTLAALLHDVVEDTPLASEGLLVMLHQVGLSPCEAEDVHRLVMELTDVYTKENFPNLNRKKRKELEAKRLGRCSARAQTIKYCDLIDNTASICAHDLGFAKVYLEEKAQLLSHMDAGDAGLRARAFALLDTAKKLI